MKNRNTTSEEFQLNDHLEITENTKTVYKVNDRKVVYRDTLKTFKLNYSTEVRQFFRDGVLEDMDLKINGELRMYLSFVGEKRQKVIFYYRNDVRVTGFDLEANRKTEDYRNCKKAILFIYYHHKASLNKGTCEC